MKIETAMKYPNAKIKEYDFYKVEIPSTHYNIISLIKRYYEYSDLSKILNNCKLQLRTLSSLTEEEKAIIRTYFWSAYRDSDTIFARIDWKDLQDILSNVKCIVECIDYLRSINIDIDKQIESGEAEVWTK